jgi:hypothetical protein
LSVGVPNVIVVPWELIYVFEFPQSLWIDALAHHPIIITPKTTKQPNFCSLLLTFAKQFSMASEIRSLNSSFLSGSLFDDSRSLFEQWKRHLEFQYDFVKVFF